MSNKNVREYKEMLNLFADPKFARQAWKAVGTAIALQPATKPIEIVDKDGNPTPSYEIEKYSYENLVKDIKKLGKEDREPTELEMILHCQMIKARTDTSAATFIRDTLGARPVDESKIDANITNPYEGLSDEELDLIAAHREAQRVLAEAQATQHTLVQPDRTNDSTVTDIE